MKKLAISAAVITVTIATALSAASAGNRPLRQQSQAFESGQRFKIHYPLVCGIAGGTDFSNDVVIINKSTATIPAGTKMTWSVVGAGAGVKVLAQLAPGKGFFINNAFKYPVPSYSVCSAKTL